MRLAVVIAPLRGASTYRRGVFLLLGGVIALPYALLGAGLWRILTGPDPAVIGLVLLAATAVIAGVPAFLRGARALEIAAARSLLGVDLPDPADGGAGLDLETRLRAALWYATHLVIGGALGLGLLIALPMALVFVVQQFAGGEALDGLRFGPLDEGDPVWLTLTGLAVLVALGYLVAVLGALAASLAPVLLGPSPTERIAALEARSIRLAERNRLARELHDSVGHALTVATLQAGAARELLDGDPEFARRALAAIEETGRAALEDLDHVLGLLREGEPGGGAGERAPQRTLGDLDRLVADTRAAGLPVEVEATGTIGGLPAAVSREGYRIVQEGLTNAARHGDRQAVTLRIAVSADTLGIELSNATRGPTGERRRGRGLHGMRERVTLLGGEMSAGPEGGTWRVSVALPIGVAGPPPHPQAARAERAGPVW